MMSTSWRIRPVCTSLLLATAAFGIASEPIDVASSPAEVLDEALPGTPLTGPSLRQKLDEAVPGVSWKNAPLRQVLRQTSEGYAIAVLCDRRIDPTTPLDLSIANAPLRDVLHEIAVGAEGDLRVMGNVAFIAPPGAAGIIRTLGALRTQELTDKPSRRTAALVRPQSVFWNDLTTPADVLNKIADRYDLSIENPELLPHDQWAGAVLPEMTAAEMLSLVLVQFDLTFAWSNDRQSIRLVRLPEDRAEIRIERSYPTFQQLDETLADWKNDAGDAVAETLGAKTVIRGPLELHEMIDQVRIGERAGRPRPTTGTGNTTPLARRQFTLSVSRVPASAIMRELEESGISFEIDAEELKRAGIDLNALVTVDVKQADAREFLSALFSPIGLRAEMKGVTVTLQPAKP